METSIFTNKDETPDRVLLHSALGESFELWMEIRDYVLKVYPDAHEEWNFPGAKYGWNFRMKDKKRAIVYLLPREGYFMVAFVFGVKATAEALAGNISQDIKNTIEAARVYAEGRGFRIEIREAGLIKSIKKLVDIKVSN